MCNWVNVQEGDNFDWLRNRGRTTSGLTGPSVDHTKGTPQGYYMFIETSAPRVKGDTARLLSEVFPPRSNGACFQFYYHASGPDIGSLRAYLLLNQSNDVLSTEAMLWRVDNDQGSLWQSAQFPIGSHYTAHPFQVS